MLIHSATGGVGLAALQIARHLGAEVIATAGTEEKRAYLRSLGIEHVFNSRSTAFAADVRRVTGGVGVDVVLNSLSGDAIAAGLEALCAFGRFVELGKRDIYGHSTLALQPFRKNLSFFAVDLDAMMRQRPRQLGEVLREVLDGLAQGQFTPLPTRRFPADAMAEAFQELSRPPTSANTLSILCRRRKKSPPSRANATRSGRMAATLSPAVLARLACKPRDGFPGEVRGISLSWAGARRDRSANGAANYPVRGDADYQRDM